MTLHIPRVGRRWTALLVGIFTALLALPALAQLPGLPATVAPAAGEAVAGIRDAAPAAIPLGDIPQRADEDERYAEETLALASGDDGERALAARLDRIATSVEALGKQFRYDDLRRLPALRLESLERHWKFEALRFADVRSELRQASAPYTDAATSLATRRADWEATRRSAAAAGVTGALVDRADAVIALLQQANDHLSAPLARQLQLGRRANALDARIDAGLKAVQAAIVYSDRRLAWIDSAPLLALHLKDRDATALLAGAQLGVDIDAGFIGEYATTSTGHSRGLRLFQLLLLPLLVWLGLRFRRRIRRSGATTTPPGVAQVLRRPLSTWLLLAMLGVLVFEPDAPMLVQQLAMLAALVPLLRLLPPESRALLGPWPYAATALYLMNRLGFFMLANAFLYRWYVFTTTVVALLVTAWLFWRSRQLKSHWLHGHAGQLAHAATWLAMGVLVIAAIANLIGNATLAEMLTGSLIDAGYMGLVLFVGVTVGLALLGELFAGSGKARLRITREHAPKVLRVLNRMLVVAALVAWLVYASNRFRLFRPAYAVAHDVLTHAFTFGELSISLGAVLVFAIGVVLAVWVAQLVRFLLGEEVLPKLSLPRGVGNSVASLSYYALLFVGLLAALAAAGFKIGQLAFLFGAMGVGIGLGLQDVVKNFVSGLILMFERPIQPGDVIDISGTAGRVREIGMRATTIKTFEGADVVVPNGTLLSEKLTNWTLTDMQRRLDLEVGVAYGSDPGRVQSLLLEAARGTDGVAAEPAPMVLFAGFGGSSLDFSVRAWTQDFDHWPQIRSAMATRVNAALAQAGIEIPFPQQDLHLRSLSQEAADLLRAGTTGPSPGEATPR